MTTHIHTHTHQYINVLYSFWSESCWCSLPSSSFSPACLLSFFFLSVFPLLLYFFSSFILFKSFQTFLDLLPLLLRFCWPWNRLLMGTQWPRAEPTRCIQMWPPAIIAEFPTLNKHSFNSLSSGPFMNLYDIHSSCNKAHSNIYLHPNTKQRNRDKYFSLTAKCN